MPDPPAQSAAQDTGRLIGSGMTTSGGTFTVQVSPPLTQGNNIICKVCGVSSAAVPVGPPPEVPEASTLLLLASGLAGLAAYGRLRWRARRN